MLSTAGTILLKDFTSQRHFQPTKMPVELKGFLSYDQMILMFYITITAMFCQSFVGSKVVREHLIIIKNLGVQLETETLQGGVSRRFIDIHRIRDIVINEVSLFR